MRINSQKAAGNSLRHLGEKFRRLGGLFYGEVGANEASCQKESRGGANGGRLAVDLRGGGHAASPVSAEPAEVFQHVPKRLPCPFGHLSAAQPGRRAPRPRKCSACANDEPGPGAATQELALTKICPSLPPAHFGAGAAAETPSFCSRRGGKREKGRMVNVATATRVLVRLEGHRGHRDQKSSSHSAPSSAATRRAASSTRPACRARRRAAQPRPPPRRSRRT